ncbi:PKD domain-containing protein [Ferruginibacter sp. SUN106]|uniref:PKD domain-containing protein n=1 Tax=Ferruginibacter sp. SUN106 TaxID=2978348 RepID=UPI003D36C40A
MRKFLLLSVISIISIAGFGQDFSNKGKDFWVGYGYHQVMLSGSPANAQEMVLYFATDQVANVTVSIPLLGYSVTYNNIAANTVFQTPPLPKGGGSDARLYTEGLSDKGIHVTSDVPIVAYAHIYNSSVSGATVLYPVPTLGKQYYSVNFTNNSNIGGANCWFYVVAVDTGTTVVSITPSAQTQNWAAGSKNTVTLTQGQVYNVMGFTPGNNGVDLTGSVIESIASGTGGCKRIAVFSGSGRIAIACNGTTPSSDNYMVQGLPKSAWGKNFLTVPSANYTSTTGVAAPMGNIYRICVTDPTTVVTVDGLPIAVPLNGNFYYELPQSATFRKIVADKPIMVAQYFPSQNNPAVACGPIPSGDGDPEVIYLSPVEQSINEVRWDACANFAIKAQKHYINVVIPNGGTAISSILLDGAPLPAGTFAVHPQDPAYSYAIIRVAGATGVSIPHVIKSDSGFNAIAYGYGPAESYGYNAGTNVKDLNTSLEINSPNSIESGAITCVGTPFGFKVFLPNKTSGPTPTEIRYDSIRWSCSNTNLMSPNNFPVVTHGTPTVTPDSINFRNGKEVAWYSIPGQYSFTVPGTYQVTITVYRTSSEGCGNEQDYTFNLVVNDPPGGNFSTSTPGCYLEPVTFTETTPQTPKPTYKWLWNFGDPASGAANTSTLRNPVHIFSAPGTYPVNYTGTTTTGCEVTKQLSITVLDVPNATIATTATSVCINSAPAPQVTFTITGGAPPYQLDYSLNNIAQTPVISATNIYTISVPTNVATTYNYRLDSVKNQGSTLCKTIIANQTAAVTVNPNATIALASVAGTANQTLCVNTGIAQIDYSIGSGGTGATFTIAPALAGLSGAYNATTGIYSITGIPPTAGTYTITVRPTGTCTDPAVFLTATLNVSANATLALAAGSGTPNPTLCINTPILSPIIYDIGGGATGGTVLFTPPLPGVTGTYNAATKQVTIQGTPTISGSFSFSVSTVSTCINPPPMGGTIIVNPDATLSVAAGTATQTLCVNNAIAPFSYQVTGTVTGVTLTGALPPGVNYVYTAPVGTTPGSINITGTPTAGGTYTFSFALTGPCQLPTPLGGTINVTPDATISLLSGSSTPTVCVNNSIPTNIVYQVFGAVTAVNVTGLPAGVNGVYVPGNPGTVTISGTPTAVGSSPYTITITGPCQVPLPIGGTITVTADATLTLNSAVTTPDQTVCVNNAIANVVYLLGGSATGATVTGSLPPGVTWAVAGNTLTIQGTPTVVSTTPVVYNYTVNTQGPCAKPSAPGKITVNPDHVLSLTSGSENQTVCSGTPIIQIKYTLDGGATGVTVTGLPAAGLTYTVVGNIVTITGSPTATVPYTIQTTGNACQKATRGGNITVVPLPAANFNFSTPSCNTRVITFTDNSVPNAGTLSGWAWNFGDPASGANNTSTQQNPSHTFSLPGTYTVGLIATTSPNGCSNATAFTRQVVINERPKTDFTVPTLACVSDNALFTDASTSPITNAPFNVNGYKWDFGDPASGASNTQLSLNGTHFFSAGGTYTVTHISQSAAGCADTITHTVNIASAPVANFSVTNGSALCVNDTVAIVNLSSIGIGTISKLEIYWDFLGAPGTFITDNAPALNTVYKHKYPNFQAPITKSYRVVVRAFSGISCTNDKVTDITINAVPKVQFNAMPDACYNAAPFQITQASEIGGVPGSGVYTGPGVSPTGLFNPVTAGIGTHTIKYTYTSLAGCMDTMSSTIKVLDTASAKFSYVTPVCDGSAISFTEGSTAPAGVTLNNTTWNFGDGSPIEQHAPGTTFTHNFPTWGSYNVTMFNTSAYGCKSTNLVTSVRVNPIPQPAFGFVQSSVCLPNAAVSFTNTSSIADNSAITYLWDFGDPASGGLNTSTAKIPPAHIYTGVGPYTVKLTVIGATGTNGSCSKTITQLVNFIHPQPVAAFDLNKAEVCIGDNVIVTDKTNGLDGSVIQWHWGFGDGTFATTQQVQHTYTTAQTYNIELYIVNSQGCTSTVQTQQFRVNPYPTVNAGPDAVVLEGGSYTMQPVVTGTGLQYLWSPATYLSSTTDATPTANVILNDITYTLTVTGTGGCTAPSDNVFIKVLKAPKVPNTFTPNGDGINELWLIDYLDTYPNCKVQVFTRTGQLVFESKGYKTPWNGKLNGKPLPFDTYYYIIEPGNGRPPMTGYVTIIK